MATGTAHPEHSGPLSGDRLHIRTERRHEITLIIADGELDHTTSGRLRKHGIVAAMMSRQVVLDLDRVTFFDSAALGALVAVWKTARERHGQVIVARPPGVCRRILERTGLDRHIIISPTLQHALARGRGPVSST